MDAEEGSTFNLIDQLRDLGYESRNAIMNLSTVALLIWLYYAKIVVFLILKMWTVITFGRCGGKKTADNLSKSLFFS